MRSMVKLHDLANLVDPPRRGIAEESMLGFPKDEAMELDEEIENRDENTTGAPVSPGDANLGLG